MKPIWIFLVVGLTLSSGQGKERPIDFARDIQPILSDNCFQCHGPDEKARKADLRLDQREQALALHDGVRAIVPGNLDKSELYSRVTTTDEDDVMPPPKTGKKLKPHQIELIRNWIAQGAEWSQHWAFVPPKRPPLPTLKKKDWPRNPIDSFVLARLEEEGMQPAREADRATWLRRVTLDLTGLPPTIKELDAFQADLSPKAYETVVARLLSSPRYGEHMARYWLDAARYADTNGYQYDKERKQWIWRDWVIHAFNSNKPFDRFTIEQIAGDLLPDATDQTRLATAFNRNHPITIEGGVIDEEYRTEYVVDRVVTVSTVWMGLTMICGRCHDHKYDPISQSDFYRMFAFFNQVPERGLNGFNPMQKIASPLMDNPKQAQILQEVEKRLARLKGAGNPFTVWEKRLAADKANAWKVVVPQKTVSTGGATFKVLDDQSLLAGGKNPAADTYVLEWKNGNAPVKAIRLEALTHPSLTQGSTSRGSNGNFVLSEFEVAVLDPKSKKPRRIKISKAEADYEQIKYGVAQAIDGVANRQGWAVDGNTKLENRVAVFTLANAIPPQATVQVKMIHNYGASHQIGRFRLAQATGLDNPVPLGLQTILATAAKARKPEQRQKLEIYLASRFASPEFRKLSQTLDRMKKEQAAKSDYPSTMVMSELGKPRPTHILERGEYDKKRDPVQPGVPTAFGTLPEGAPANRLGLAQWLVSRDNPLTARVTANRFWQQFFGTGIVKTCEDFGVQSEWPSHPELLDWLAVSYMNSKWDTKALVRAIVLSATYRQASHVTPEAYAADPENRLLARGPRLRLDAEVIRDAALFAGGLLIERQGGASVYPYHPKGLWMELNNRPGYSRAYPHQTDSSHLYRRSLYTFWKRTVPPPSLATFDAPEREFCVVRRSRTNTPLQGFILMNDPQFVEAARFMAERMMAEGGSTPAERLRFGFRSVTSRRPATAELAVLKRSLDERLATYRADPEAAHKILSVGLSPRTESLNQAEHAAYTSVARMLLNLSETITKE